MSTEQTLLLAITGSSPAVVTETLYGIDRNGQEWPKAIKIITTTIGKKKAIEALITDDQLNKLCRELRKPNIAFTASDILAITNAEGKEVEDARSLSDHEALANFIMTKVHSFTQDENTKVHASLAGGRKTMTFYLGYAMSFFGRHFDKLSHVLVTEGYEQLPGFFFPTRESVVKQGYDKKEYDFKDAEVTLADIPFIRQRSLMPTLFKENRTEISVDFRNLVNLINLGDSPDNIRLKIHQKEQSIEIFNKSKPEECYTTVKFNNYTYWCFYLLILEEIAKDEDYRGDFTRPKKGEEKDTVLTSQIYNKFIALLNISAPSDYETLEEQNDALLKIIENACDELHSNQVKTYQTMKSIKNGFNEKKFSEFLNKIKENFATELPANLVAHLTPSQIYKDKEITSSGKGGDGYGVKLSAHQIQWLD